MPLRGVNFARRSGVSIESRLTLELLAWKPERLVRVTSILAKLCAWKINDNWANKPMGTLKSIFRFWMPQTAASLDQRNRALETLTKKFPEGASLVWH